MSPNLDALLCQRYPEIFVDRNNPDSCMHRGFACGDGWFNLIDRLCYRIQVDVDLGCRPQPVAAQVKEKLGGLRIYWRNADDLIRELSYFACDLSLVTCELCGTPGEAVRSPRRVLMVRCAAHWHLDSAVATQVEDKVVLPSSGGSEVDGADECFPRAVEIVVRRQRVSVSLLQRHLKLGHERARRLVSALEVAGIVSAPTDEGERSVLRSARDVVTPESTVKAPINR
jgi:hypothetical protein